MRPCGRLGTIIVALALMAAGPAASPVNLDLEAGAIGGLPTGWTFGPTSQAAGYDAVLSADTPEGGKTSARLVRSRAGVAGGSGFGNLSQKIDATAYRGHRIRFRAAVRARPAGGWAGLWLRVDRPDGRRGFFENMQNRPVTSSDWTFHDIEGVVAPDATVILFGLLLAGGGEAGIDTASLEDLGPADLAPHGAAKAYLDDALGWLEREHINSAKADWKTLRAEADLAAAGAATPAQTYPAIRAAITTLGERHTLLFPPAPPRPPGPPVAPVRALPQGRFVGEHIAVLTLPTLLRDLTNPADDGRAYRDAARDFIALARDKGTCGWIVDLRDHGGGDMWPGMMGLAALLGPGPHGVFINAKGREPWPVIPAPSPVGAPVAVLIGPRTGSSGEMIAIAFEGWPSTRFFGAPTIGLTTANSPRVLSDGAVLTVTTSRVEDRTGHLYDGPILPDEPAPGDAAEPAAVAWLEAQGCRSGAAPTNPSFPPGPKPPMTPVHDGQSPPSPS
ncbi:periplasmic protease [Caulobacter sp. AP07]|uniref:S41 family peptidase n=1 Tax=Caulobacter sp. AP07 TaxID=1144304 RepID=UPI000271EE4A|nr:S41 family peptidase [Caulobacter sp. AP07]EJL23484.1 periplasmic protease [Caulobacter sp. AP07]